jgi:hypothetical protein
MSKEGEGDSAGELVASHLKPQVLNANEVAIAQTQALTSLATSFNAIAVFITNGGLAEVLNEVAKSKAAGDILGGLAAHDGRNSLDARVLKQNALEITHAIEHAHDKFAEIAAAKKRGEERDPDIHDAEADLKRWEERNKLKDEEPQGAN